MAHYVCNRCGAVFDEIEAATENFTHTEIHPYYTETYLACPHCLSNDFEDAAYCYRCKKPIRYGNLRGGYYCKDCIKKLRDPYHERRYISENIDDFAEWIHALRVKNNADEQDAKDQY